MSMDSNRVAGGCEVLVAQRALYGCRSALAHWGFALEVAKLIGTIFWCPVSAGRSRGRRVRKARDSSRVCQRKDVADGEGDAGG